MDPNFSLLMAPMAIIFLWWLLRLNDSTVWLQITPVGLWWLPISIGGSQSNEKWWLPIIHSSFDGSIGSWWLVVLLSGSVWLAIAPTTFLRHWWLQMTPDGYWGVLLMAPLASVASYIFIGPWSFKMAYDGSKWLLMAPNQYLWLPLTQWLLFLLMAFNFLI